MAEPFGDRLGTTNGYPAYVRKLDKMSSWGHASDEPDRRALDAAEKIFPSSETRHSLFLLTCDDDLERVVVGLNGKRSRLRDQVDLIAFSMDELTNAGVVLEDTEGDTECETANLLHVDVRAGAHDAYVLLCKTAIESNRDAIRVLKSETRNMADRLRESGCQVFPENHDCTCVPSVKNRI